MTSGSCTFRFIPTQVTPNSRPTNSLSAERLRGSCFLTNQGPSHKRGAEGVLVTWLTCSWQLAGASDVTGAQLGRSELRRGPMLRGGAKMDRAPRLPPSPFHFRLPSCLSHRCSCGANCLLKANTAAAKRDGVDWAISVPSGRLTEASLLLTAHGAHVTHGTLLLQQTLRSGFRFPSGGHEAFSSRCYQKNNSISPRKNSVEGDQGNREVEPSISSLI